MIINEEKILSLSQIVANASTEPIRPAGYSITRGDVAAVEEIQPTTQQTNYCIVGNLITNPRERSSTPLSYDDLLRRVKTLELEIQDQPHENILAIDECGNVLMHLIGGKNRVSMSRKHWNAAKVVTHNHPDGGTLSGSDISHLFDTECQEVRACCFNTWYSARRTAKTADKDAETVLSELTEDINDAVKEAAADACFNNSVGLKTDSKTHRFTPINNAGMSVDDFGECAEQAGREFSILSVVYTHSAVAEYAADNEIDYNVGEL